jgi:2-polyprenyl-3-methyl-5-hydroxy-6-metoxy-1,4-benzoquinol methylase
MINLDRHEDLRELVQAVLKAWPAHENLANKSLEVRSPEVLDISNTIAALIKTLASHEPEGLEGLCKDYQFLCEKIVLPEELYFRRNGTYRLSTFADAEREVYANADFMRRYMNGLLVSDAMWSNHAEALSYYVNTYLPSLPPAADHLEIGPGHGLLFYFAAARAEIASITGWDVSPTSIKNTQVALQTLQVTRPVTLTLRNLFDATSGEQKYDSIVLSEILEHLEDPVAALRAVKHWLKPGGRVWVHVPANSPAPDHLFLVTSPEHACDLVREAGLEVEESAAFAMTGTTLDKATRRKLAISCLVTGRQVA